MENSASRGHLVIVSVADMPEGSGRTSRLKTLAAAFREAGASVRILIEHALTASPGQDACGVLPESEIPFEFVLRKTERPFGFRAIGMKVRAVLALKSRLNELRRKEQLSIIVFNNLALYDTLPLTVWARRHAIATIQCYEDERQEIVSADSVSFARRVFGLNSWLADRICPSHADAVIVISKYLLEKYRSLSRGSDQVFLIPPIIDCAQWEAPPEVETNRPVLLYAGFFSEQDEIEAVIDALALLRKRGHDFFLRLIGADPAMERVRKLEQRINEAGLADFIRMEGFRPLAYVRQAIFDSNLLLSIRRQSTWSRSGQSTKLSEFLASGRLVVAAAVGDNSDYLRDQESAILLQPDASPREIAAALEPALVSAELRRRIGRAGREVALRHFGLSTVSAKLRQIMDALPRAKAIAHPV